MPLCNLFGKIASNECMTNEKNLIDRVINGDDEAFALIMEHYAPGVFTLIVRITRNDEVAEELTQDVFVSVYKNLCRFGGNSSFSTWLYRIAYNAAISHSRRQKHSTLLLDEGRLRAIKLDDVERMEAAQDDATIEALAKAMEQLEPTERALITLFYYEERSTKECAEIMEQSEGNIKVRLHRIRKKLYLLITENGYEK